MDGVSETRLAECKLLLVAQLALRRGEFWELVRNVRAKWSITAVTRLPPPGESRTLYPEHIQANDRLYIWQRDLEEVKGKAVHPRYFPKTNWRAFISLCCLYDPPASGGLPAFGDYGGTSYDRVHWPNPYDLLAKERATYEELVSALLERLRLAGRDPEEEIVEALHIVREGRTDRLWEIPTYDVAELVEEPARRGRPRTIENMVTALECVILRERHGWSYEHIADHNGWLDYTRVSNCLESGRTLLNA